MVAGHGASAVFSFCSGQGRCRSMAANSLWIRARVSDYSMLADARQSDRSAGADIFGVSAGCCMECYDLGSRKVSTASTIRHAGCVHCPTLSGFTICGTWRMALILFLCSKRAFGLTFGPRRRIQPAATRHSVFHIRRIESAGSVAVRFRSILWMRHGKLIKLRLDKHVRTSDYDSH